MGHNKTISLDEDTAKIADRLPNFSRFVRQCLLKHAAAASTSGKRGQQIHVAPESARIWGETKDKCNPRHKKGRCPICWGGE
tara:strand:+ start:328 stop:573 length:246 start_codon:yes stop_codon:yes gene_type:complete